MILEPLGLILLGFVVGFSGALIPGPLLAFTILDTSKKGRITGHTVIVGHALWEFGVILLILLGFGGLIAQYKPIIYALGGLVLILMGVGIVRGRGGELRMERSRVNSSLIGGVFYTAFNPTQPPWWATAGLALLLKGSELMGIVGIALVTLGHWLSDFTYYIFVSYVVHRHEKYINPRQNLITTLLGSFMALLGAYFLIQGLQ